MRVGDWFMTGGWEMFIWIALIGVVFYFILIRPQQKRAADQKSLMATIQPGTRVLLSSGMIGTVRVMGDNQAVIELAPGTDVTVLKQVIVKPMASADEEFEYADAATPAPAEVTDGFGNAALWQPTDIPDSAFDSGPGIGGEPDHPGNASTH